MNKIGGADGLKGNTPNFELFNKMGSDNFDKKTVMVVDSKPADFSKKSEAFVPTSKPLPCCKGE